MARELAMATVLLGWLMVFLVFMIYRLLLVILCVFLFTAVFSTSTISNTGKIRRCGIRKLGILQCPGMNCSTSNFCFYFISIKSGIYSFSFFHPFSSKTLALVSHSFPDSPVLE